jgi:DNA invertase Pin-like site-specific DNA recombinase
MKQLTRAVLYARVSTLNGHQGPEMQLRELREFALVRGSQIVGEFIDHGVSGSKDRRPQLDRMMDAARSRKVDVLIVWKLDRFARSLKHMVVALSSADPRSAPADLLSFCKRFRRSMSDMAIFQQLSAMLC